MKPFRDFSAFVVLMSLIALVAGCAQNEEKTLDSTMVVRGYILEVKEGRILVAQDVSASKYAEIRDKTIQELDEERVSLIYFSYDNSIDVKAGDEVKVWVDGIDDSYPAQSHVKKIEVEE
ncbi:DUF3221 domain-containing protein [Sutcliffiella horikoshii]|uniref:DUF3221 domain-containing protein n=1 Tax=Sutcliffiella horikoshii TaxID=79883 RepID=UPI00384DCD0F